MKEVILNAICSGDCTLFTGAGFSVGARNIENQSMPVGSGLAKILYDSCGMDNDNDLSMAAGYYKDKFGETGLIQKLRYTFYTSEPTPEQIFITKIGWRSIYTTNYDNVLETAFNKNQIVPNSAGIDTTPSHFTNRKKLVVHINGNIEDIKDESPIPSSFKLTDVAYATNDFLHSAWHSQLLQDISSSEYTIFIGCSLRSDLDLKRILQPSVENGPRQRAVFIVREDESEMSVRHLSSYGLVLKIGLDGLCNALKAHHYVAKQHKERPILSFHKYFLPQHTKFATSNDAFNLMFGGRIDNEIFFHSVQQPSANQYFFEREVIKLIHLNIIGGEKNLLIISDIGNGKSIVVEAVSYLLMQDDFQVYRYEKAYDSLNLEIETINAQPKPVLIVESYAQNRDLLEVFQLHRSNKNLVLIVTERTALYETSIQTLEKLTNKASFSIFDTNNLENSDIENFSKLLTTHGLWGDSSSLNDAEKKELIKRQCNSTTREVLLRILQSENIISKFSAILTALKEKKEYYQAIILILSASRFNIQIDLQYLNQVLNTQNIRHTSFDNNLAIKELIDLQHGVLKIRSSIVAEALLEKVSDVNPMIDALIKICQTIDEWEDETSKSLLREYISYGNLKWLCERKGKDVNEIIFYFFEKIRNLKSCNNNHHYWLQYAILDIDRHHYDVAHQHLEAAYALARKKRISYDTYQIDNQLANLQLKEVLAQEDATEAMKKFKEAHKMLTRSADPNRLRHYPYKVASLYVKFYNKFFNSMTAGQKDSLIHLFGEMAGRMDEYLKQVTYYREKRFVSDTRKDLMHLIEQYKDSLKTKKDK